MFDEQTYQKEYRLRPERVAKERARAQTPARKAADAVRHAKSVNKRVNYRGWLKRVWNLEPEDVARMFEAQGGACACCHEKLKLDKQTHLDHDHKTGKIRELLCHHCNIALGGARDSIETLQRLIDYLRKHQP